MNLRYRVSEDQDGLRVFFRVKGYPNAKSMRFKRGTPKGKIDEAVEGRIRELKDALRAAGGGAVGTFAADVERYMRLPGVRRLRTHNERKNQLALFTTRFGTRNRLTITKQELETALGDWQTANEWSAGTFNKYVTAIKHFYNGLDDPDGRLPNPARRIDRQAEPDPLPRALTYEKIHELFDAMGRRDAVPPEADAEIRRLFAVGLTRLAIAQRVGFSKETVGKVLKRPAASADADASLAEVRLRVIAFTGMRHGQVARLEPENYDRDARRVLVPSAKGNRSFWKPLDELGVDAMDRFVSANAWGPFDRKSLHRAFKTALKRLGLPQTIRPYDLRHSYLTAAYEASGDILAVKTLSGHTQLRTLERYTKGATDKRAEHVVALMSPSLAKKAGKSGSGPETSPESVTGQTRAALRLVVNNS